MEWYGGGGGGGGTPPPWGGGGGGGVAPLARDWDREAVGLIPGQLSFF